MAAVLGAPTELVLVPGAGHSVNITRPRLVGDALVRLLARVSAGVEPGAEPGAATA